MGNNTPVEQRGKREYSLAYNRAAATLKARYPDEFRKLLEVNLTNIRFEREFTGSVSRRTMGPRHVKDDETGLCYECGKPSPCRTERDRIRHLKYKKAS